MVGLVVGTADHHAFLVLQNGKNLPSQPNPLKRNLLQKELMKVLSVHAQGSVACPVNVEEKKKKTFSVSTFGRTKIATVFLCVRNRHLTVQYGQENPCVRSGSFAHQKY